MAEPIAPISVTSRPWDVPLDAAKLLHIVTTGSLSEKVHARSTINERWNEFVVGLAVIFSAEQRRGDEAIRQRDRLREALANESIRMEYDYPGDAPEECGLWCHQCNEHVEGDGSGHAPKCLLVGCTPAAKEPRRPIVSTPSKRRRKRGDVQAALSPSGDTPAGEGVGNG